MTLALEVTFRVAVVELAVSAVNYFVLMQRVYEQRVGAFRSHRIGMTTRIVYIFGLSFLIPRFAHTTRPTELAVAGLFWLGMILVFEWGGSFLLRRPVHEILEGWHVERGYLWPYVLLAYVVSPPVAGLLVR